MHILLLYHKKDREFTLIGFSSFFYYYIESFKTKNNGNESITVMTSAYRAKNVDAHFFRKNRSVLV